MRPGRVLVQTFQPDSRAIELTARHDVEALPPTASSTGVACSATRRSAISFASWSAAPTLMHRYQTLSEVKEGLGGDVLGPAPLLRLRGKYRAQLVAKTEQPRALAAQASRLLSAAAPGMISADIAAVVDVDPQSL